MKQLIILFFFLSYQTLPLAAEPFPVPPEDIQFQIQGRTSEASLRRFIQWDQGRFFASLEELQDVVEEMERKIANTRLFRLVDSEIVMEAGSGRPVVVFKVQEPDGLGFLGANTLLLPVVTFNTNTGLVAGAGYQDQNFLGNMAEFRLNGEFRDLTTGSRGAWVFGSWTMALEPEPQSADLFLGFNLGFDLSGQSFSHLEGKYRRFMAPGLSSLVNFRLGANPWTRDLTGEAGLGLELHRRWENLSSLWRIAQIYGSPEEGPDTNWLKSEASSVQTWDFRTYLGFFGSTKLQWEVSGSYYFWPGTEILDPSRKGLVLSSKPVLSLDGVFWEDIFRTGGLFRLGHSWIIRPLDGYSMENTGSAEVQIHAHRTWAGVSLRILGDHAFSGSRQKGGKELRGILDDSILSLSRGVVNLDLPLRIPLGPLSQALEFLAVPFLDSAMVLAAPDSPNPSGLQLGSGVEVVVVPAFAKTALIRLSAGWDLTPGRTLSTGPGEIALELSHFY